MLGYGDAGTWPAWAGHPGDPRDDGAQDLRAEAVEQLADELAADADSVGDALSSVDERDWREFCAAVASDSDPLRVLRGVMRPHLRRLAEARLDAAG